MTAICIWRNDEIAGYPGLWVTADSRVTAQQHTVLVEDAAKVLSLPIVCRSPGPDGFFTNIYHSHTVGYSFAGSTLMGQNAYLALVPLLSNLISPQKYVPSLSDVASYIHGYLRKSFDDYKSRVGPGAMFEAAVFGVCAQTGSLSIYHLRPELIDGEYVLSSSAHNSLQDGEFVYLGDERKKVCDAIAAARVEPDQPGRPKSRLPKYIIQDFIDDPRHETIGGDIQLAVADRSGFRPFLLCKPRVEGQPQAYFSYLGREFTDDLIMVGQATVGNLGMV